MTTTVDLDPDLPDRIAVWSDFRLKARVKSIPGARWDSTRRHWHIPKTWPSCLALRAEMGEDLLIKPDLREWAQEEAKLKAQLAAMRGLLEPLEPLTPYEMTLPGFADLFPHQIVDAQAIRLAGSYLLYNETGVGKSRGALAGLSLLHNNFSDSIDRHLEDESALLAPAMFPLMIVCGKSMAETWRREVLGFFPAADIRMCTGTPSAIKKALEPGADVYIINYDVLRRYSRVAPYPSVTLTDEDKRDKEIQALNLNTVLADEIHRAKSPKSQRTRALWAVGAGTNYRIGLTGTPIQDNSEDLWSVLRFIAPNEYGWKTAYVDRYLEVDWNRWGGREVIGVHPLRSKEFFGNLDARTRRVTKAAALPWLPEKIFETRWVELPPKLRKAYNSMASMLIAELEEGEMLTAKNVLEKAGRLTQLANSSGTLTADGQFIMAAPSPKIDAFMDDIKEGDFDGQQVVVFSDSRQLIELLADVMAAKKLTFAMITGDVEGSERQDAIDSFQAGECQFMLITRAGGEGVTLTAASTMVRLFRSWSSVVHQQAEDRVHRIGSEVHSSIKIVDYISLDTVEEGQIVRLSAKAARAEEVLRDKELLDMLKKST